ncbi:coagulation factor X [Lingula anatina]|uniref:Coagulation factor X n=1 Tax=Lingula anatina TaxID=7574 RepID=A0A1S3I072_LINAN|nr:coagulation factor X [Lingula anatina]|eukprot:XP_013391662.1 coagulation factor X [Lingula anatina]
MKAVGSHALVSILQEFIQLMVLFTVNMVPTSACFFILLASHSMLLRQNGAEAGSSNEADDTSLLEQTKLKIFALEARIKADCVNWPELLGNLPPTSAIVGKRNTNVDLTQQVINIQDAQQLYGDMTALYRNCSRGPKPKNCPSEPCYNGGSCIDDALGSVTCVCTSGFTGKKCQTALTPVRNCPSEPCYNGGTCIDDAFGSVTCVCRPGYTGKKCQTSS